MSTPSPLLSPGVLEGVSAPKSRVRITVLTILALHVVFIGGLLLQGCQKSAQDKNASSSASNLVSLPPLTENTNYFSSYPGETASSSLPSAPTQTVESVASVPSYSNRGSAIPGIGDTTTSSSTGYGTSLQPSNPVVSPLATAPSLTEHTIAKGDTIGALAKRYGVSEQAIKEANPSVRPRALKINDRIQIPAPTLSATGSATSTATEPPVPAGGDSYVVQRGDTLSRIAKKFGVTVQSLRSANGLRNDRITIRQHLIIPAKAATTETNSSTAR